MKYYLGSFSPLYQNPAGVSIRMIPRSLLRGDTVPSPLAGRNIIPSPRGTQHYPLSSWDATLSPLLVGRNVIPSPLAGEGQGEGGDRTALGS